eukprot:6457808-Amphidinium_carterae.3
MKCMNDSCKDELKRGDGPVVLVLAPHKDLAEQTRRTAEEFCNRAKRENRIRTGIVYGGVDVVSLQCNLSSDQQTISYFSCLQASQLPSEDDPDYGAWPEVLVATPGIATRSGVRKICPGR